MKLLIASDIHGSEYYCEKLINLFEREKADRLLLLGDILYHGPRNDLPKGYNPKGVIAMLNPLKDKIMCVRGNCDAEVDQMVLEFSIMADYAIVNIDNKTLFATHGHKFNPENLPALRDGDILLCGHTHIPANDKKDGYVYFNTGSVSIPKENSPHSCIVYENGKFSWIDILSNEVYMENE